MSAAGRLAVDAPAKLNLYLEVAGRRPDGFHELVTVMTTLALADRVTLEVRPRREGLPRERPDVRLTQRAEPPFRGPLPDGHDNLATRAAAALLVDTGCVHELGVDIELVKRVPAGGGLGGGSSDAAAVLGALNRLIGSPCDAPRLSALAAELGSDVPFFLVGGTALCLGRGERVTPIHRSTDFDLTLLMPSFSVSTPRVYEALRAPPLTAAPDRARQAELVARMAEADERDLQRLFRNDLERAAAEVEPRLARMLARVGVHLSGSGSTLFAFGRDASPAPGDADISSIACVRSRSRGR